MHERSDWQNMRYNDLRRCAMSEEQWAVVDRVDGLLQAEILQGMLEAQGIQVVLSQEGAGHILQVSIGTLGAVEILVPASAAEQARQLLDEYYGQASESSETETEPDDLAPE
jgi:hypothetical protein